nr:immunoglobulin light chain junction region [Macaca mulatta]
CFQYDSRPFTF